MKPPLTPLIGQTLDELIDAMGLTPGAVAVDVGCGTGALTRRLARQVAPMGGVVGADINPYLLREASAIAQHHELAEATEFEVGSAEALRFPDGRFESALACTAQCWTRSTPTADLPNSPAWSGLGVAWRCWFARVDIPAWDSLPLRPELRETGSSFGLRGSQLEGAQTPVSIAVSEPQASPLRRSSKRMHYAEDLIGPGGWVIQFHGVPLEIGIHGVFEPKNVELMQYAGLEDKNGKEIYEGDIVRTTHINLGFWKVRAHKLTGEVVYQPGAFTIGMVMSRI